MFTDIQIRRLGAGSIYKLVAIGLAFSLIPLCVFFGILAAFGAQTVTWNGQALTGLRGLAMSPVIGLMFTAFGTAFVGTACVAGLGLYSLFRPMSITAKGANTGDSI